MLCVRFENTIRHHVQFGIISLGPTHFISACSHQTISGHWNQNFKEAGLTGILPVAAEDHHFRLHAETLRHDFGVSIKNGGLDQLLSGYQCILFRNKTGALPFDRLIPYGNEDIDIVVLLAGL